MFDGLFSPRVIAVVGAAREEGKVGHEIFDNIINAGFKGKCYPVNPKADNIHGFKCYPSISDLPEAPEVAVIIIPAKAVPPVLEECGKAGTKYAVIISAGFKESGPEGSRLEAEIKSIAKKYGLRFVGPNCLGVMDTHSDMNMSFAGEMPKSGNISFLSQSGALLTSILDFAKAKESGFSKIVSLGNKADINEIELVQSWADDKHTKVIVAYLEGITDGEKFKGIAGDVSRVKPIIALKSGTTDAGARAVSSHTGSLAGSENAYRAAFKQSGVIQAETVEEMLDFAEFFGFVDKVDETMTIVTNAGGPGIIAADACERAGIRLSSLSFETVGKLREKLPPASNFYNPVDVLGDALADRYEYTLKTVAADKSAGTILVILTPQAMTQPRETAEAIVRTAKESEKTVVACFMGKKLVEDGVKILRENEIPVFFYPEKAIKAVKYFLEYQSYKQKQPEPIKKYSVDVKKRDRVFEDAQKFRRRDITDIDAREILEAYGFKTPPSKLATRPAEAAAIARELGFPIVLKITSPDILHKTDVGGIKIGLNSEEEVLLGYQEIIESASRFMPDAMIWGVSVQKQLPLEREVILGMNRDPQFGPLLLFGLGGIYVEVLKDVSFRIAPIDRREAEMMIREIKSYPLLRGIRGKPGADIDCMVEAILKLSQLVTECPQIIEMDINPLMVGNAGKGCVAVDARISVGEL